MRSPMHFTAGDHVDARDLLFQNSGLGGPQLRIREIPGRQLTGANQSIHGFIPSRNAMRADHRGRIFIVMRHA